MLTTKGLVLLTRDSGEQDRFIDVLTAEYGVIEVLVRGGRKIGGKNSSAAQLFAYSQLSIDDRKKLYVLDSASPIRIFYGLRESVSTLALVSYFGQVIEFAALPKAGTPELLRLTLNCFYMLSEKKAEERHIKPIFELRAASLLGFMPDVLMCRACGEYLPEELLFSVEDGYFCCKECAAPSDTYRIAMPAGTLQAIRQIVLPDLERIFSFRVKGRAEEALYRFAEEFLCCHLKRHLPALDYYHTICQKNEEA